VAPAWAVAATSWATLSSVNALLDNVVPLGDGNTDDQADMDDDMSGAADWRWPAHGGRACPQRG
jgi:hypothetical protein